MQQYIALSITGLVIGLLMGFSASPVLSVVLTSLMGAAATVSALLGNYPASKEANKNTVAKHKLNALPLALLSFVLLVGAVLGVQARVLATVRQQNERLESLKLYPPQDIDKAVAAWVALGLDEKTISQSLFEKYIGIVATSSEKAADATNKAGTMALLSVISPSDCQNFATLQGTSLYSEMSSTTSELLKELRSLVDSNNPQELESLKNIVTSVCEQ